MLVIVKKMNLKIKSDVTVTPKSSLRLVSALGLSVLDRLIKQSHVVAHTSNLSMASMWLDAVSNVRFWIFPLKRLFKNIQIRSEIKLCSSLQ